MNSYYETIKRLFKYSWRLKATSLHKSHEINIRANQSTLTGLEAHSSLHLSREDGSLNRSEVI
jgi:hypothetical protein